MTRLTHHPKMRNIAASFFGAIIIFLLTNPLAAAAGQSVTLAWVPNANPNVAGFKIYYGSASRSYTNSTAVGNVTNTTINGLDDGATYYFAATTYDNAGHESTFSEEVVYFIPALVPPPPMTNSIPPDPISVVTNTPPIVTNTPPVIPDPTPVVTNTLPVIPDPTPVVTNTLPVVTDPAALPKLNSIPNLTIKPSGALRSLVLTGFSAGKEGSRIVSVTAASSDASLISNLNFQMGSSGTAGTLVFRTATNALGTAVITVTVRNDNEFNNTFSRSFSITLMAATPVSNLRPPTFFRKPGNTVTVTGKTVSLTAAATGPGLLKYAWKFNGKPIAGATAATLTLKKVSTAQTGLYTVSVTSAFGSTNSRAALTVYDSPAATLGTMTRAANGNFTFPVTGIPGYKYVVQATTDLTHWTSVQTNNSPFVFEDRQTSENEKRFFRAYYDPAL